jgi:hypothetical protein
MAGAPSTTAPLVISYDWLHSGWVPQTATTSLAMAGELAMSVRISLAALGMAGWAAATHH